MVAHSPEQIAHLVQRYLRHYPGVGKSARVAAEDVRMGDSTDQWWWVPVMFDPDPTKRHTFYTLLSEVEEQLELKEHLNVLLIPRPTAGG
ncbi:MAG: hypothetical protein L0Y44_13705 [Phycisphaerales bacterium]|nr:hypothetical protein [Phycisphaerales bacterium]MCI0631700.1 hypothetical protein [Phycisphaerales bacterium]MCI0675360.1 hypothetical protein [Phycisphaerales bacterium]